MDKMNRRIILMVNKLCGFNVLFQCLFVFSCCDVKCLWFNIFVDLHHMLLPLSFANRTLLWSEIFSLNWAIHLNFGHPLPSQHVDHLWRFGEDLGFWHLQRAQRQEHQDVLCWYGGLDGPRGHTQWTCLGEGGYLVGVTSLSNRLNIYQCLLLFP